MEQVQPDTKERTPSSRVLEDLLHQAPPKYFTLGWLISNLQQRSFGIVVLFLGLLATTPVGSTVPGLMLAAVALQMITGRREIVFPKCITIRSFPTAALLLTPVPLSNIPPAIAIVLISLAYLEGDGLLLCYALLAAVVMIIIESAAVWGTIVGAAFISRIW